ncbi:MAG: hypothetical protein B7Y97_13130 [Sphingomonas sp. 32-66-10]|nr:MAG: hypothetical protein B7Y97_13130 [Sphingomonas sp. 32-66-10]
MIAAQAPGRLALCADGEALAGLFTASGLFTAELAQAAGALAGAYPAIVEHDLFLEFELGRTPVVSGFGVGFPAGAIDALVLRRSPFWGSGVGRALSEALAPNPFAEDERVYLNLWGDDDPDWVEHDVADGSLEAAPFVFFRPPSRFRWLERESDVRAFASLLPTAGEELAHLIAALAALGPVGVYRIGLARSRPGGFCRAILTGLTAEQAAAGVAGVGGRGFEAPIAAAAAFYAQAMDTEGACFALSVDICNGAVTAVDVEAPYLRRAGDLDRRAAAFAHYAIAMQWPPEASAWLAAQVARRVHTPHGGLDVRLQHLKHRLFGEPHGRLKAYLHLQRAQS